MCSCDVKRGWGERRKWKVERRGSKRSGGGDYTLTPRRKEESKKKKEEEGGMEKKGRACWDGLSRGRFR